MTKRTMAKMLAQAYFEAPRGKITLAVRLFSIKYAEELKRYNLRELIHLAEVTQLEPTIKDGMNLSEYVRINSKGRRFLEQLGL